MDRSKVEEKTVDNKNEDINNIPLENSNNSDKLNPHNYTNENYNVHGVYDPNFNAGLSSYKKEELQEEIEETVNEEEKKPIVNNPLLKTQAEVDRSKKFKKFISYIMIMFLVAIFVGIIIFIYKVLTEEEKMLFDDIKDTNAFFIRSSANYYALFNEDGEQLTEFIFTDVGNFYGGVAKVEDQNGREGIIKENGEYLVELSNIDIYGRYSLYEIDDNSSTDKIKNFKGEIISEGAYLDLDSYAYGAMFSVTKKDANYQDIEGAEIFNYAGISMDTINNIDDYNYYSYDGSYVSLISNEKSILYNIDKAEKVIEVDGTYCITDSSDKTVILKSCSTWSNIDEKNLYRVIINGKEAYTSSSLTQYLSLTEDGAVFARDRNSDYYNLLDDNGEIKQDFIIGYQSGKNYIVEQNNRLMFYKNNNRKNILDCASYYQNANDEYYIIKVDRYADGCKDDVNNRYTYYDLSGNPKSNSFYFVGRFNDSNRAIVSTDNLENYIINDSFEVLGDPHYSMREVGSMYIVWDEKHNQALIDKDGKVVESTVLTYSSYSSTYDDDSYIAVEVKNNEYVVYNSKTGDKITTVTGKKISVNKHYFIVDNNYYSYKTGKIFYEGN